MTARHTTSAACMGAADKAYLSNGGVVGCSGRFPRGSPTFHHIVLGRPQLSRTDFPRHPSLRCDIVSCTSLGCAPYSSSSSLLSSFTLSSSSSVVCVLSSAVSSFVAFAWRHNDGARVFGRARTDARGAFRSVHPPQNRGDDAHRTARQRPSHGGISRRHEWGEEALKQYVASEFEGIGWRSDEIVADMLAASNFYASGWVQVKVPRPSSGRSC